MTCGGYGTSRVVLLRGFDTGRATSAVVYEAPKEYFLEGCTLVGPDRLLLLTWRERKILELSVPSFKVVKTYSYIHDGWGITYDDSNEELWTSDGSSTLRVLDPVTLVTKRDCVVTLSFDGLSSIPVKYINELEWHDNTIYANVYMEASRLPGFPNYIIGVDPVSCHVSEVIPLFGITSGRTHGQVLNGIAKGFADGELIIGGKMWDSLHSIRLGQPATSFKEEWSKYNITSFLRQELAFR